MFECACAIITSNSCQERDCYMSYISLSQDLINSDDLLAEEDLIKPDPTTLRSE